MILEPKKIKFVAVSIVTPSIYHEVMGPDAMILVFFEYVKAVYSGCLFNLYSEYKMWNARLDESQARIKIARRNINNLRCADGTTLMAESEEELKSLFMEVK